MELLDFLLAAKLHGYASAGERDETKLEDGGKRLRYRSGEFFYQDIYYGTDPFIGEEVVWQAGRAVWAMTYYGLVLEASVPAGEVYAFLQQAMRQVGRERPFRGPELLQSGDWEYRDASQGDLGCFSGEEQIFFQGRLVYRLSYHGGRLGG
jgi:hypothetical protein